MASEDFMESLRDEHHDEPLTEPEKLEQAVIDWATEVGSEGLYALATVAKYLTQASKVETGPLFTMSLLDALSRFRKANMTKVELASLHQLAIAVDNHERGFQQ